MGGEFRAEVEFDWLHSEFVAEAERNLNGELHLELEAILFD